MGKNLTLRRKAAIVNEETKYRCHVSERLPKGALDAICLKFHGISSVIAHQPGINKLAHNGGRKRAENTGTSVYRKVNIDDYNRIKNKLSL